MVSGSKSAFGLTRSTMLAIRALLRQSDGAARIAAGNFHFLGCEHSIHWAEMGSSRLSRRSRRGSPHNRDIRVRLHRFGSARAALAHVPETPIPAAKQALDAAGTSIKRNDVAMIGRKPSRPRAFAAPSFQPRDRTQPIKIIYRASRI